MPALRLGLIDPVDAVAAFERRKLLLPSFRWQDVYQQEHARGVAVAGVMRYDLLQVFADELGRTVQAGGDLRAFRAALQPRLEKAGYWGNVEVTDPASGEQRSTRFDRARLELIFDVNMRQSYAAGRWERIEASQASKPFLIYVTMRDEHVRASHRVWDGLVLPVNHPFWETHFPPNGWRCRCYAFAVSEKDIARLQAAGVNIQREAPPIDYVEFTNRSTGEVSPVPRGIDPGFAYNPGKRPLAGVALHELASGQLSLGAAADSLAATWKLPLPKPVAASALMPLGLKPQAYVEAFLAEFGNQATYTDVTGEQLLITDELFRTLAGDLKVTKRGREQFVKLIAQTIKQPDEIWMTTERHFAKGADVVRRRYMARFAVEGQDKPVLGVFEVGADGWRGVTGYQAESERSAAEMLASLRKGSNVYRRIALDGNN